jgi:hypothetical protein
MMEPLLLEDGETTERFMRREKNCFLIAELLDSFEVNPAAVRAQLRTLPEIRDPYIGEVFSLVVFLSDDFLSLKPDTSDDGDNVDQNRKTKRFFVIARMLPMELQMVLCNRIFKSPKDLVLKKHSEPGFKKLAKLESSGTF